jgi:hypothetical protein
VPEASRPETADRRRLVLVVGAGRSGTSLLAGVFGQLGFHIPQPEVDADDTNPRGFGEPRWVVDFHTRLLRRRDVTVNDSRPSAWQSTTAAAGNEALVGELRTWLAGEFDQGEAVVVKDPRTVWFLPLWTRCASELGVPTTFVTMLRHPAEILASAIRSYGTWQSGASRAAAWMNMTLEAERLTRGAPRAFVPYESLMADWRGELARVGSLLDLPLITEGIPGERAEAVDAFIDPTLHRNRVRWEDVDVPPRVVDLAEQIWQHVLPLAEPGGDAPANLAPLEADRDLFVDMHSEAEAIAQSAITAARSQGRRKGAAQSAAKPPPSLRVRIARRIPVRYRRRLRRAAAALRRSA